ncbi:MAG: hypothetical protein RH942_00590 [Kiloniellaceae bacterium]
MTIGIVASGPRAGLAVFKALQAVERVGAGAIGGFAAFAAVTAAEVLRGETQRGGSATLFTAGERTGGDPDLAIAMAPLAGVMSSGPDRPQPLAQFVPALAGVGLVSGHRLPNMPGRDGVPVNLAVLDRLRAGRAPREAVESVLAANPAADAGIVAASLEGGIFAANSDRVAGRPDLGHARASAEGATVEVLHNAIYPVAPLAALAAEIALDVMLARHAPDGEITLRAETPVTFGNQDCVIVDEELVALEVKTSDARVVAGTWNCAAVYLGARVLCGGKLLGATMSEPNMMVIDGRLVSMSGQREIRIGFRKPVTPA